MRLVLNILITPVNLFFLDQYLKDEESLYGR